MTRIRSVYVALCIAAFPGLSVQAAELNSAIGAGDATCEEALASAKQAPDQDIYVQWASGQITGMISISSQRYPQDLTIPLLAKQLHEFCRANPKETIFVAASTIGKRYTVRRSGA